MKKLFALILALAMIACMTACSSSDDAKDENTDAQIEQTDAQNGENASAGDEMQGEAKDVILMVSFGTSYNDAREAAIDTIEADAASAYPDWEVRRAFTSDTVNKILADREGLEIDNVTEAMERLIADGVKNVVVQPTHIMNGFEFDDLEAAVSMYKDKFDSLKLGEPLLTEVEDYREVIKAVMKSIPEADSEDTAIVFMGHGTHHYANATYSQLELMMHDEGYENVFIGTVEGYPTLDNVLEKVTALGAKKVILYPFMITAGDHASNDMAGDEDDSWKSIFEKNGFEVECRVQGLGENEDVRAIYISHIADAMNE